MIDHLVMSLKIYRTNMEYNGKDFHADRPAQYAALRMKMSMAYGPTMVGAEIPLTMPDYELTEDQKREEKKRSK